jgi:O-acetyl-ADP-ribose deacetylase
VRNALTLAHGKGFRSIGFPLIGSGSGYCDPERAKAIMLGEIQKVDAPMDVVLVVFKKR